MNAVQQLRELVYASGCHELTTRRLKRASEVFRFMTMLAPDDERAWLGLGETHLQAGHDEVALVVLETGVRVAASTGRCLLALCRIVSSRGDIGRARELLSAAMEQADLEDADLLDEVEQTERSLQ